MAEIEDSTADTQHKERVELPANILQIIIEYQGQYDTCKMSQACAYYNMAVRQYYKMWLIKNRNFNQKTDSVNWRQEYAKIHSLRGFTVEVNQLKLDPEKEQKCQKQLSISHIPPSFNPSSIR